MALKTATTVTHEQGIAVVFGFADIDDGDTFVGPASPKSYTITNKTDNTLVTATESSGTYTFTVAGAGSNKVVDLRVPR